MFPDHQVTRLSKYLSLVLRHKPELAGITLDENGWTDVATLLNKLNLNFDELRYVVDTNNKKRFAFNEDFTRIRANQGHSVTVDLQYHPQIPPDWLYHGTAVRHLDTIRRQGLRRMNRHHVHLSSDESTARAVGQRHGQPVVLTVQAGQMYHQGYIFFLSANGVWLTDQVPSEFIKF